MKLAYRIQLELVNNHGDHKATQYWTLHAPNGTCNSQIDYILVQNHSRSWVNNVKTKTFLSADIRSNYDLVIMNFQVWLKKNIRVKFNVDQWKNPTTCGGISSNHQLKICTVTHARERRWNVSYQLQLGHQWHAMLKEETMGHQRNIMTNRNKCRVLDTPQEQESTEKSTRKKG